MQIFARQPIKSGSAVIPNLLHFVYSLVVSHSCHSILLLKGGISSSSRRTISGRHGHVSMYHCSHWPPLATTAQPRLHRVNHAGRRGVTLDTGRTLYYIHICFKIQNKAMIHDHLEYCLLWDVCTTGAPDAVRQSSGNLAGVGGPGARPGYVRWQVRCC